MSSLINISDLTIDYGNGRGIFNFNINVEKGEVHAIVGTNGSGKTTTLRALMGFIKANGGSASINSLDCWTNQSEIKKIVSYVPGEINFPDVGSGESFLNIQKEFYSISDSTYMNKLINIFGLDIRVPLRRMSKGMKQKAALICAFMKDSDIILLDEPSTGLDPLMRDNLITLINEEKKKGKTILMSSHIFKEIEDTCDKVTFINNGKIIETIDLKEISNISNLEYKISFKNNNELNDFLIKNDYEIINIDENSINIYVEKKNIKNLFLSLSNYQILDMEYVPYNLEKYYTECILGGKNE